MSTANKEEVERGDPVDAIIPTPTLVGGEDDVMSAGENVIGIFTASPTNNEASSPKQVIATNTTASCSNANTLDPVSALGCEDIGRLSTDETSEIIMKELIAELESKLKGVLSSKARNATVATEAVLPNRGPSLTTSASGQ